MTEFSAEDSGLLELMLEEEGIELFRSIPRRKDSAGGALSFSQQRLWFLHQLDPSSPAYNLPRVFSLRGPLDVAVLERSLSEIVERHEVLRTTFKTIEGEPVQVINPARPVKIASEDLRGLAAPEREMRVRELAEEEARRPFDLESGPLLRSNLLMLADAEHVLLFTMHHIVSDEWSTAILIGEVSALYDAFVHQRPSPLPALHIQYADYASWQREWLQGAELERQLAYWKTQLAGGLPRLELLTDRPRLPLQTFTGASKSLALGERLSEAVRNISRQEDATLFITLYAAFTALLHRYTGQQDVVIGSPIAGRNWAEVEGLIGFFVNTLVLRAQLSGDPDFRTLLCHAREVCLGAYAHQDVPFEKLVEELQPERSLSHTPLYQVAFALRAAQKGRAQLPDLGLEMTPLNFGLESAKFDLFLSVEDTGSDLKAALIYNTDLFDETTAERMLEHYRRLLEGVVAEPTRPVSALSLLTEDERRRLLFEWNETAKELGPRHTLHELFEAQVERTPDAVALVFEEEALTYRELNARANRLAHHLRALGVGAETIIALLLERSTEMVVSLLATLKAGAAYLPLDPTYPVARLSFMLDDARPKVLLTQHRLRDLLAVPEGVAVISVDEPASAMAAQRAENPRIEVGADNLAYLIYTSGSTGTPKGVMVAHRAISNRLLWMIDAFRFDPSECILQKTSFSFDASIWELFVPLFVGGRLVLARPGGQQDSAYLAAALAAHRITTLQLVPSMLKVMVGEAAFGEYTGLRRMFCGGEVLSTQLQERFYEVQGAQLHNLYGPTEAAIDATHCSCGGGEEWRAVPIGRPIANMRMYVLDARMEVVTVGVAGELYIGGVGLARGYHGRAGLTGERFVPHPYSEEGGARLYRTGDVGRYREDGAIEYLGRRDEQVKIRGFRIELGEVEAALLKHEQVREAVVVIHVSGNGEKSLVAYVVAEAGVEDREGLAGRCQEFLRERLPEYMRPTMIVRLDKMPLTANGKIDRRALPTPTPARPEPDGDLAAPRTPVEEIVAAVWSDVLDIERVGTGDDFFALGGHSLLAARVITLLKASFNVELPLRAMFEHPTVARLAEFIEMARRAGEGLQSPPLVRVSRERHPPLSFAQQSLWFEDQLVPGGNTAYNIQTTVRLDGPLDTGALEQALNEILRRHESLRTNFADVDWQPAQIIAPALTVTLPVKDLTTLPEDERETVALRLAAEATREPFDLARDPLLRVVLFRLGDDRHLLVIVVHHIIFDAWSMGVFTRELAALYEAYRKGLASPLAELPIQYADYAHWQREWLQGEVLERQLAYWTRQLGDLTELRLPTDRPRPAQQSFRGAHLYFRFSESLSDSLRKLSRKAGVTLYMLALAAFQTLLHYYSDQEDIAVGTNVANRGRVATEGLIGYFVNVLVLRTSLAHDPTFVELLARVRSVSLGAFEHQEFPFDKLVEALKPERDMSRNPLFQILFGLNNHAAPVVALPELSLTGVEIEKGTNLFDLTLFLTDMGPSISGLLRYSTDLFDAATIERMREQYEALLGHVAANPHARLSALREMLSEDDHQRRQAAVEDLKKSRQKIFKTVRRKAVAEEG